nr:hypothetical protein [Nocardia yamanashiensis]
MCRFRSHRHDVEIVREQDYARFAAAARRGTVQEHGLAQGVREVRSDAGDQRGLGVAESERMVFAVQAQITPALRARDQRRPQFVPQSQRPHDLAIPLAGEPVGVRHAVQRGDMLPRNRQCRRPVHVFAAELVVEEQRRRRAQRLLRVRTGEQ